MPYLFRFRLLFLAILAGLLLTWVVLQAAPSMSASANEITIATPGTPTPLPDQPAAYSPDISFIDSPSASCILPRMNTGVCYLTWSYMYADASPNYIITMTVSIDSRSRARYHGFFQTSMFVPQELMSFQVPCGEPGAGGDLRWGANYGYTLRARDSAGLASANYGTVTCPADVPARTFLPLMVR